MDFKTGFVRNLQVLPRSYTVHNNPMDFRRKSMGLFASGETYFELKNTRKGDTIDKMGVVCDKKGSIDRFL